MSFYCRGCRIVRDEVSRRLRRGPAQSRSVPRDVEVSEGRKWCPECGEVKNFEREFRKAQQKGEIPADVEIEKLLAALESEA